MLACHGEGQLCGDSLAHHCPVQYRGQLQFQEGSTALHPHLRSQLGEGFGQQMRQRLHCSLYSVQIRTELACLYKEHPGQPSRVKSETEHTSCMYDVFDGYGSTKEWGFSCKHLVDISSRTYMRWEAILVCYE